MDHHRQRNEAKKRRVTIVSKSAFLRAVIEAMNEVNLMRKKDPRRLTEDMLFSPHPPEPPLLPSSTTTKDCVGGRQTIPDVPSTCANRCYSLRIVLLFEAGFIWQDVPAGTAARPAMRSAARGLNVWSHTSRTRLSIRRPAMK
jgi:hypothetical protein